MRGGGWGVALALAEARSTKILRRRQTNELTSEDSLPQRAACLTVRDDEQPTWAQQESTDKESRTGVPRERAQQGRRQQGADEGQAGEEHEQDDGEEHEWQAGKEHEQDEGEEHGQDDDAEHKRAGSQTNHPTAQGGRKSPLQQPPNFAGEVDDGSQERLI